MRSNYRIVFRAFGKFAQEIWDDIMFAALLFIPILMGLLFRFGIPFLERELCIMQKQEFIIAPYYICFDLCIIMLSPIMFAFAGVMVILGEMDNGMASYLMVTPLGKSGYLWSRIGLLSVIAMVYSCITTYICKLSDITILEIIYCGIVAAISGAFVSFFVVSMAHNKVEGMALTKFSAFFILGIPISIFVKAPIKFIGFFLPTFWATEFCVTGNIAEAFLGIATGILLLVVSYRFFTRKI